MSSPPPGVWLDAFNFTGGYPQKIDLGPSIFFAVIVSHDRDEQSSDRSTA